MEFYIPRRQWSFDTKFKIDEVQMAEKCWNIRLMGDEFGPLSDKDLIASAVNGKIDSETQVRKGASGAWRMACEIKGLFEAAGSQRELDQGRDLSNVFVSTGPPPTMFEVIDIVFAVDSAGVTGFWKPGVDVSAAFEKVKARLKISAFQLGADGVFNCHFEYRDVAEQRLIEIFAYGTAVKFMPDSSLSPNSSLSVD